MGEIQTQKYICKICSKSCVSGKSLGGHMRVHLALISASKRSGEEKSQLGMGIRGDHDQESCKKQSNSYDSLGDGDQSTSYELRENPKKSWRISDPKRLASKGRAACRECSKVFPSLRALSGHMRSHSVKNKEVHECKKCGKCFDSIRAMFGHMKSHSMRSKAFKDTGDGSSDLDSVLPIRGKRSRISCKTTPVPSWSSLNGSELSAVSEVEDAAKCLMMLSRNERDWEKFDSITESSDDDSVYFGAKSSCRRMNSSSNEDFLCDDGRKIRTGLRINDCVAGSANAYAGKNVSDNVGSEFGATDHEMEVDVDVCNEGQPWAGKVVEPDQSNELAVGIDCFRCSESAECVKHGGSGLGKNSADGLEILNSMEECGQNHRQTCSSVVNSCSDGMHYMQGNSSEADIKFECSDDLLEQANAGLGVVGMQPSKMKEHECTICLRAFSTGQALGGHKRTHYGAGTDESNRKEAVVLKQDTNDDDTMLDLNYPIGANDGPKSDCAHNMWRGDRCCEPEAAALVLTT